MFLVVRLFAKIPMNTYLKLVLEVIVGVVFYLVVCFVYWRITKNKMCKEVFGRLLNKLHIRIED